MSLLLVSQPKTLVNQSQPLVSQSQTLVNQFDYLKSTNLEFCQPVTYSTRSTAEGLCQPVTTPQDEQF